LAVALDVSLPSRAREIAVRTCSRNPSGLPIFKRHERQH
jgi:hypothetical protein